jgi:hypothetical protein
MQARTSMYQIRDKVTNLPDRHTENFTDFSLDVRCLLYHTES